MRGHEVSSGMAYVSPNIGDGIIGRLSCQLLEWLRHLAGILKRNIRRLFEGLHGGFGCGQILRLKFGDGKSGHGWKGGREKEPSGGMARVCSGYGAGMERVWSGRVH